MSKTTETKFDRLIHEKRDLGRIIEFLNLDGKEKTKEDINQYFVSQRVSTDTNYIDKLLEIAISNQLVFYGKPIFEGKKTIDTYKPTRAGKRIYRGILCQQEQAQQI
ncbi:hypothetical protein J4404_00120 [Candidatus Woesearchaeota archaeon]|nr:hypothetical protein [Candidatus Woesearchaeota archaeon]